MSKINSANVALLETIENFLVSSKLVKESDNIQYSTRDTPVEFQEEYNETSNGLKKEHKEILDMITKKLIENPELRFTQVLWLFDINEKHGNTEYMKDNFYNSDKFLIKKMKDVLNGSK